MIETAFPADTFRSVPTVAREEKWKTLKATPEFFEKICDYLSGGGTLPELATCWDIPDGWLMNYCVETPERERRMKAAEHLRGEWFSQMIIAELRKIGFVKIQDILNDDGSLKDVSLWPKECSSALSAIDIKELYDDEGNRVGTIKKVKFTDRLKALEMLGKHTGLLSETVYHEMGSSLEKMLSAVNQLQRDVPPKVIESK